MMTRLIIILPLLLLLLTTALTTVCDAYQVTATRQHHDAPILSYASGMSQFNFTYNAAAVSLDGDLVQLFVRCQNKSSSAAGGGNTPSVIAMADLFGFDAATSLSVADIVFEPEAGNDKEAFGTEDPRVVVVDDTYYMLYSAVSAAPKVVSRLSLATSKSPRDPASWVRHGPVVPNREWSKSGALVVNKNTKTTATTAATTDAAVSHLLWGDSADFCGLHIATTKDLLTYDDTNDTMLACRNDHFDSHLVEAGPAPLPLSDGNLFFIYNSARLINTTSSALQYNIGWAVLDGSDPTRVLKRSETPLLSPTLDWEINGLVPNVVFCEGMWSLDKDYFGIVYGGADTNLGVALVSVKV